MENTIRRVTVGEQVAAALRTQIVTQRKPGEKLPSVSELATRYRVGTAAINQALLVLSKDGLVDRRHGSGTYVCERADNRRVGVLLDLDIALPEVSFFWRRVTQQVRCGLRAQGYRTRFYLGDANPGAFVPGETPNPAPCTELVEELAENRLCGLVTVHGATTPEWHELLRQRQVPCVGWFGDVDASVGVSYEPAVRAAARQLLADGRRKLAFLDRPQSPSRRGLVSEFRDELERHGVSLNARWTRNDIHPTLPGAGWATFREIWTAMADKPDGLVVADDILFRTVATAIQELGIRVPEQLQVVTHTNKGDGYQPPFPVWRMEADPDEYAQALVKSMVALLRRQSLAQSSILVPLRFVVPENPQDNALVQETKTVSKSTNAVTGE